MSKNTDIGLADVVRYQKAPIRFMNQVAAGILTRLLEESKLNIPETREWLQVNTNLNTELEQARADRERQEGNGS